MIFFCVREHLCQVYGIANEFLDGFYDGFFEVGCGDWFLGAFCAARFFGCAALVAAIDCAVALFTGHACEGGTTFFAA